MIAKFSDIEDFAKTQLERARSAVAVIQFSESVRYSQKHASLGNIRASMIGDEPDFKELDTWHGIAAFASILSVDLRHSSKRAIEIGPKDTYLTMHTYLPTLGELVLQAGGRIVGLRGDGLIAAFGIVKKDDAASEWGEEGSRSCQIATQCGQAMIEATEDIINPILEDDDIAGGLATGVGIAVGEVVVTRIGLRTANEVTAYGPPVNQACKLSNQIEKVRLSPGARQIFPRGEGGRMGFSRFDGGFIAEFPSDMYMLERPKKPR